MEDDAVSDFLAREKDELAGLDDQQQQDGGGDDDVVTTRGELGLGLPAASTCYQNEIPDSVKGVRDTESSNSSV